MKKNFFKKLSFVMALAMIISVIAPAAGAFAATGLRLNATTKTLFLGENNTYNFNALGKSKGATEKWTSSKTSVATVNAKNGVVTAKAVGTTYITATITNAKKTVTKKLKAKVVVGDNIKTLSVAAPAGVDTAKLVVGTDYKLATSYVTKSGAKSKTTNTFAWSVDKEGATVKAGVFNATVPGEYTVTVTANRYKNIKVADATIKVTVLNAVKEVKQTTTDTFTVEFAGAVKAEDLTATTASVAQVVAGKDITSGAEKIKSLKLDSTGKVATVTLYGDFAAKGTYKFVYGTLTGTFVAASKDVKEITGLVFDDFEVNTTTATGTDLLEHIAAVNKDGVKILKGSEISSYLTIEDISTDKTKGYVDPSTKKAYIYTTGNSITVKATYTNYVYNTTTQKYETVTANDSAVGVGVSEDVDTATIQYAVAGATAPSSISTAWTSAKAISVGDSASTIHARYKKTTDSSNYVYTSNTSKFTYEVSDPSKASVVGNTIYALAVGTVTVIVKNADRTKVLGSFEVQINAAKVLANAMPADAPQVSVGNNTDVGEVKELVIKTLDNLGNDITVNGDVTKAKLSGPSNGAVTFDAPVITSGKVSIPVNARGTVDGTYRYKVTVNHSTASGNVAKDVIFDIVVVDSKSLNARVAVNYAVAVESAGSDLIKTEADFVNLNAATSYNIEVYAVNASGYRVAKVPSNLYAADAKVAGETVSGVALSRQLAVTNVVTGSAIGLAKVGVYNITASTTGSAITSSNTVATTDGTITLPARGSNVVLNVTNFNLKNSYVQSAPSVKGAVDGTTYNTVSKALDKTLELSVTYQDKLYTVDFINGNVVVEGIAFDGNNSNHDITNNSVSAGQLYIKKVTAYITVDTNVVKEFKFNVETSITIK